LRDKTIIVYELIRPYDPERVAYVGIGYRYRPYRHAAAARRGCHVNKTLQSIFRKAWKMGFDDLPVRVVMEGVSWQDAAKIEVALIARYGRMNNGTGCLANLTDGGEGVYGLRHSEETRKKLVEQRAGTGPSKDHLERLRRLATGRPCSEETRRKIGAANRGRRMGQEARESNRRGRIGKSLSEEHKRNIAAGLLKRRMALQENSKCESP
jgi:NUMOD3 motif